MKKKNPKPGQADSDEKLSQLIEKLNAEIKLMNELNVKLTQDPPNNLVVKPKKKNQNP